MPVCGWMPSACMCRTWNLSAPGNANGCSNAPKITARETELGVWLGRKRLLSLCGGCRHWEGEGGGWLPLTQTLPALENLHQLSTPTSPPAVMQPVAGLLRAVSGGKGAGYPLLACMPAPAAGGIVSTQSSCVRESCALQRCMPAQGGQGLTASRGCLCLQVPEEPCSFFRLSHALLIAVSFALLDFWSFALVGRPRSWHKSAVLCGRQRVSAA